MARRSVGKPRFYADVLQYIKTVGKYDSSSNPELFNLNPSNNKDYTIPANSTELYNFNTNSEDGTDGSMAQLLSVDGNMYYGILGHNFYDSDVVWGVKYKTDTGNTSPLIDSSSTFYNGSSDGSSVYTKPTYNGYSVVIPSSSAADADGERIRLQVKNKESEDKDVKLGAFTFGRYYEPEHSFDLQASIIDDYDGVKLSNTLGGSTIANITNLGQPEWGSGLPAWTLAKDETIDSYDYSVGAKRGRRQWQVGLSYLSDDKLFHKHTNHNEFYNYDEDDDNLYKIDTDSMAGFFKLTLNGKLPFMFSPDSSLTNPEFALCRITNKPSFKQVANNLFSTSLVLTETW